jgi:hypothetical protein
MPRLVSNWRRAPRMLSVQVAGAAVAWGLLPPDQQTAILAWLGLPAERVPAVLGALFLLGRLTAQSKVGDQP